MEKDFKKKLAICIPTWKRSQFIDRVLGEELAFLEKHNVDLWVYDSSPDDETKKVIEGYADNHKNVFYNSVEENIPSNEKFYLICQEMGKYGYEYIWIIQDHLLFQEDSCVYILEQLDRNPDFVFLDIAGEGYVAKFENDLQQFAVENAWAITRFGVAIMRTDTFLAGVNWKEMGEKWLIPERINNSHIGLYFDRLAEMENPRILKLSFMRDQFFDFMRNQEVSWNDEILRICLESWGSAIDALSDYYSPVREQIMRNQDALFVSSFKLLALKSQGHYGLNKYIKYKKWIKRIYPDKIERFRDIAILPLSYAEKKHLGESILKVKKANKNGRKVYIYGAGRHAREMASFFELREMGFEGFLVTNKEGNPDKLYEHKVTKMSSEIFREDVLIIIAVAKNGAVAIYDYLSKMDIGNSEIIMADQE